MNKQITSFELACEDRGYDPKSIIPDLSGQPEWLKNFTTDSIKRVVIAEAIKGSKHPQPGQECWFPVFRRTKTGFAFSYSHSDYANTLTISGARLEFFTEAESDFFGSNFNELHRSVMTVTEAE